jgi:predicted transcriptional regulator
MMVLTKERMLKAIEGLPEDATVEDAMERLYLLYKIEQGLADIEAGRTITQEEARQRLARWLK